MREYPYRFCFLLMVILVVRLTLPSRAFAQSGDLAPNPAAEQWVSEQLARGEIADLQTQFPNEEDRVLSADFLMKLLENPAIEITRYGIRIQRAVFVDPLQLAYIEVDHQFWLEDCEFKSDVNLYESHFTGDLFLRGSTFSSVVNLGFSRIEGNLVADNAKFLDKEQTANFNSMKVDGLVSLQRAEFAGTADFIGATIGVTFQVNETKFTNPQRWVNFSSMKVDGLVSLTEAKFAGPVDFIAAQVGSNFEANEAKFTSTASFNSMTVGGIVFLHGAEFAGPVDFIFANIGGNLEANEAKFTSTASFNSMTVGGIVFLHGAEFAGPVDFIFANIGGNLEANEAKFTSTASFNSMTVGGIVFLHGAEFAGPVDFIAAQIRSNLQADDARFNNKEQTANFSSMKVDGNVLLTKAEFSGPMHFIFANIGGNLEANEAKFTSTASFNSMTVGGIVFLHGAEFAGPVDFIRTQIGSNLEANDARFNNKNKEQKVNFESMKVDGHIFLNRVVFAGPVNFDFVEVKNNFDANNAKFLNTDGEPSFKNMIVRQEASFVGTIFEHGADFDNAVFLDLTIRGEAPNPIHILDLRLSQTLVERKLNLESLEIQNLYCTSLVVYGLTNIKNVNFVNSADFENSQFGGLHVENVSWTPGLKNINLGGMSYQNIQMILEPNKDAWEELIDLIDRSTYNAQAYTTLENYFLQQGYADRADEVYIRYKQREFREGLRFGSMGWWSNLFLKSVGYGRKPGFVLVGALLFILIGWLGVFRKPEGMVSLSKREIVRPNVGHRGTLSRKISQRVIFSSQEGPYSPFWYSLDLFIPFVDLGFDDKWAPRPNRQGALLYAKVHMLAGWILIPIGLLAITGVIK